MWIPMELFPSLCCVGRVRGREVLLRSRDGGGKRLRAIRLVAVGRQLPVGDRQPGLRLRRGTRRLTLQEGLQ